MKQPEHSAPPWLLRATGSATLPQRVQGTARSRASQPRQIRSLSRSFERLTTLAQCGQAGRATPLTPASQSAPIKLSTDGTGASAPAPVNSSGRSASAPASRRRWPAREVACPRALATVASLTAGSIVLTTLTSSSSGSGPSSGGQEQQRGRPARSRAQTLRSFPQAAHGSGSGPQASQYQSSPRR